MQTDTQLEAGLASHLTQELEVAAAATGFERLHDDDFDIDTECDKCHEWTKVLHWRSVDPFSMDNEGYCAKCILKEHASNVDSLKELDAKLAVIRADRKKFESTFCEQ